ncbi:two-component regulator propeller domain-containing protein [Streptomyces sp. B6B3]|uniref:ligand-binding sensor domain-containing protein n=1 Tax=Streptomyces sp. B6B3 TaxID=3153570 RepID=UPI00325C97B5
MADKSLRPGRARSASRNEVREQMRRFLRDPEHEPADHGPPRPGAGSPTDAPVWESLTTRDGLPHDWIYDLFADSTGAVWVGTWGGGLARRDDGGWRVYTQADGLASAAVTCVREDPYGGIWAATSAGLCRLEGERFVDAGLTGSSLLTICFDDAGRLWAGAWRASRTGGGLHLLRPRDASGAGRWQAFGSGDGLPGLEILRILQDSRGHLWVGTYDRGHGAGVGRFDGRRWRAFNRADGLAGDCVYAMAEDRDGHLWFGTTEGVSVFDGARWRRVTRRDGLVDDRVYAVTVDDRGALWFGTEGGVSRFDGATWTSFTREDGLVENLVRTIAQDREGALWFGTYPYARDRGGISIARSAGAAARSLTAPAAPAAPAARGPRRLPGG